jgi:hypothetical protein
VTAAVNAAGRGDTVQVPAGSSTWSTTLSLTKGVNLVGAGRDSTFITTSSTRIIQISPDATAIANEETIRVTGFTFDGSNSALCLVGASGAGVSSSKPFKNLAVGNCRFRNTSNTTSGNGTFSSTGQLRGVIYGNIFDRCNVILKIMGNDDTIEWSNGHFPQAFGTADNLFFENNVIQYSTTYTGGDPGWIESGQGGRLVVRYNTFNFANTTCTEYWDIHGFQNWPGNGQTGTMVVEYYGNTLTNTSGYRWICHRGGWGLFHNNILTGANGGAMNAQQYNGGCVAQVTGASGVYDTLIENTYAFNNTVNGTVNNLSASPVNGGCGETENLNWYNYNPSFNGSTGIGRGTGAPTGIGATGVAFWKCSTPMPTVDPTIVQAGTLYKCLTPNVWTAYYRPYTYPHPLTTTTSVLAPPASLRIVASGP